MFSWTIISLVSLDNKEGSTNCGAVNCISRQRKIVQNHFTVPQSDSNKEEQATVRKGLYKVSFALRLYLKDISSPHKVRGLMVLDGSKLHHARNIPGVEKTVSV